MADFRKIDELLRGSIDMHVHHGPDTFLSRRLDALEVARQAEQAGQQAIVLKSHKYPTAPLATLISQFTPGVRIFGSLSLDHEIGGLNIHAVKTSALLGAKVLWMPTGSSQNSMAKMARLLGADIEGEGYYILDKRGKLLGEVDGILKIVKQYDMVLATGHISAAETMTLVRETSSKGLKRIIITHPNEAEILEEPLNLKEQKQLAATGAFIEHTFVGLLPTSGHHDPDEVARNIREVGPEHVVISSDLGQIQNPPPVEGMRIFIAVLLKQGFSPVEVELMAKVNPARLLGLSRKVNSCR